jgi:hypothetical protein
MFIQVLAPAVVMLEQQLCGARNIHGAEYRGWQGMGKRASASAGSRHRRANLCGCHAAVWGARHREGLGTISRRWH